MGKLLAAALALLIGLLMTRVFKLLKLRLPDVTAFLIAGLIIVPVLDIVIVRGTRKLCYIQQQRQLELMP